MWLMGQPTILLDGEEMEAGLGSGGDEFGEHAQEIVILAFADGKPALGAAVEGPGVGESDNARGVELNNEHKDAIQAEATGEVEHKLHAAAVPMLQYQLYSQISYFPVFH